MDLLSVINKKKRGPPRVKGADDLPPGWVRVESRSKPGAVFYAHPATNRTQVEKPTLKRSKVPTAGSTAFVPTSRASQSSSSQQPAQGPQLAPRGQAAASASAADGEEVVDLDSPAEDPAQVAERRRKAEQEKAEAEERARQEAFLRARERKVRELQAVREQAELAEREEQEEEPVAQADAPARAAPKSPGAPPRRVALGAASDGPAGAVGKKRKKAWNKDESSDSEGEMVTKEDIERWRVEEERRETEERERREQERRDAEERERLREELEGAEEECAEAEAKEDAEKEDAEKSGGSACEGEDGDPCLDVMKDGAWVERHILSSSKKRWLLGRAAASVDISMQHESISRQHAALIRRGDTIYVADLGSAHGTSLNGTRLEPEKPAKLSAGDEVVFGASTRTYIFRDEGH